VHCDFCHKAAGWADGAVPGLTHGRYALRLARPDLAAGEEQVILGPLDDADRPENAFSPFQRDSRLCAACHEGTVFGVPVYTTFSEWRESLAGREGRSCQSCHLPAADGHVNAAPDHGGIDRDPSALSNHTLFAGSRSEMLRRALRLRVTVRHGTGGPTAEVELLAVGVGHRVPTGFIDRNLTLEVQGYDADGRPLGPAAKRLFARQLRDEAGRSPVPFWRPGVTADDTRLRPGEPDRSRHILPVGTHRVRARVVARRFWPEVVAEKGWPPEATVAAEAEAVVGE
jgi:hypothetical protein